MERWKDIQGYEGLYQVSSEGRVKSLERYDACNRLVEEKILKQIENSGYLYVQLSKCGTKKRFSVHRLVAENFIPNPNNLQQVNHKDENKKNNKVDNLEWCTSDYNLSYGTRIERINKSKEKYLGVSTHNSKKVMYNNIIYDSISKAAKANSISEYYIIKNCNDKNNKNCKFIKK